MSNTKGLTDVELEKKLNAARYAERRARARVAKLKRGLAGASRRTDMQRKCCLGGVLLALANRGQEADMRLVSYVRSYLLQYPLQASNAVALAGTPFAPDIEPAHV